MTPSEIRERTDQELRELEGQLRDRLVKLSVARAAQKMPNTAQIGDIRRDIARIRTIVREREIGLARE